MWKFLSTWNQLKEISKLLIAFLSLKMREEKEMLNIFFSTIAEDEYNNILSSGIIPFSFIEKKIAI